MPKIDPDAEYTIYFRVTTEYSYTADAYDMAKALGVKPADVVKYAEDDGDLEVSDKAWSELKKVADIDGEEEEYDSFEEA